MGLIDNKLNFRINKTVERFNFILNNTIGYYRPKFSYFLEKYKILINRTYHKYIDNIKYSNNKDEDKNCNKFISKEIYDFSLKLIEKFITNLGYKIISLLEETEKLDL